MFVDNEGLNLTKLNEFCNRIISVHEDLYLLKINNDNFTEYKNNASLFAKLKIRMMKLLQLFVVLLLICYLYYFYVYCYTVPRFENLQTGLTLDFNDKANWELDSFRKELYKLMFFHIVFFLFLWSITRTIIYDPGSLSKEYIEVYSSLNIFISLYEYFENFDVQNYSNSNNNNKNNSDEDNNNNNNNDSRLDINYDNQLVNQIEKNNFDLTEKNKKLKNEVEEILKNYNKIMDVFYDVVNVIQKMSKPNELQNNNYLQSNYNNKNDDDDSFLNLQSNYVSNQFANYRQYINTSNALKELSYKVQIFFNKNQTHSYYLNKTSFQECDSSNNRFCRFCLLKKPDRAHHCRKCKKCIRKMDHHCDILGCCIGFDNYKSFILTLVYLTVLLVHTFYYTVTGVLHTSNDYLPIIFISVTGTILAIILYFLIYHLILIVQNKTTIESFEKNNNSHNTKLEDSSEDYIKEEKENLLTEPSAEERAKKTYFKNHKYNKGFFANILEVFGKNPLLWFIPVCFKNRDKSGYNFDVYKIEKKLKENIKTNINELKEKNFSLDLQPDSIEKNAKNDW